MYRSRRLFSMALIATVSLGAALSAQRQSSPSLPDFGKARDEAITFLQDLIRIDTSAGSETKAAEYIKAVLDKEGIAVGDRRRSRRAAGTSWRA